MTPAPIETVTLSCPDCDFTVTSGNRGKGSAPWKLGCHRATVHKWRSPVQAARKGRPRDPAAQAAKPVAIQVAESMAEEIAPNKRTPPTVDELQRALARGLMTVSVGAATLTVETDRALSLYPPAQREQVKDALVDHLSLSQNEAKEVAYPFGRALGNSGLNKRIGRGVVDNIDIASSVSVLLVIGVRYKQYFAQRKEAYQRLPERPAPQAVPSAAPPPSSPLQEVTGGVVRRLSYEDLHPDQRS